MTNDHEQHILLGLEDRLANGPTMISAEEVANLGTSAQPSLTEAQSYRLFNRLRREHRIIGDPVISDEHPADWIAFWLEDVQL